MMSGGYISRFWSRIKSSLAEVEGEDEEEEDEDDDARERRGLPTGLRSAYVSILNSSHCKYLVWV